MHVLRVIRGDVTQDAVLVVGDEASDLAGTDEAPLSRAGGTLRGVAPDQRRVDPYGDTEGLRTFVETAVNHAPFGVLVTQTDDVVMTAPRIVALPLSSLLLMR